MKNSTGKHSVNEIPGGPGCCRRCGRPFAPVGGTADSTLLEVEVRAHRRLLRRHRYRPPWDCGAHPGVVTAPPAPRVIPKRILGVTLDHHTAERAQRGPVMGRKNSSGSAAVWAGRLAALLFSLWQTWCLGNVNPRAWLTAYLTACAEAGGEVPEEIDRFLPWNLRDEDRRRWSLAGAEEEADTSSAVPR